MAANGTRSVVFIDDLAADKGSGWIPKCKGYTLSSYSATQCKTDAASFCRWIITQNLQQKQTKFHKAMKWIFFTGQVSCLIFTLLTTDKTERPANNQQLK